MDTKVIKKIVNAATKPNESGGLVYELVPRRLKAPVVFGIIGLQGVVNLGSGMFDRRMSRIAGQYNITYQQGLSKTGGQSIGAIPAAFRASKGDYGAFAEMLRTPLAERSHYGIINNYGATPAMISSLYNMGVRTGGRF